MKTFMPFLVLLAIIFAASFAMGWPTTLRETQSRPVKSQTSDSQSSIQSQSSLPETIEVVEGSLARLKSKPCVDEGDMYSCLYHIVVLEACETNEPEMWKMCRYTCNYC
ncbi:hypothetical protein OS493_021025 [Desmophyllum pertusum]|uniref:ShKT domain-containing protein n=1 Tax=Desmophyllum pertusum TaxID=174260 RepID=A0A9X0D8S0_9CNID|nr:hypothetical protein OS493_021025 [Desmophyllum pertusum]